MIIASGRFGPLELSSVPVTDFRRLEVGFRIQQSHEAAFFADMRQLDPKLRLRDESGRVEWRTFCACRQGEASLTETLGLWTVSGRSDCPPTGLSNVGFNTRVLDRELAARALPRLLEQLRDPESHFTLDLTDVLGGPAGDRRVLENIYGPELTAHMLEGVRRLADAHPSLRAPGVLLIGPTLEGVGFYPRTDDDLRVPGQRAWVAGDACGKFRGIVAALISGHYAASQAIGECIELGLVEVEVGDSRIGQ